MELKEVADQASFTFAVKGVGPILRLAVEDANKRVTAIVERLRGLGIPVQDISTSRFYSGENIVNKAFLSSSRDYQATLTTLVKVDSLALLDSVLYAVTESEIKNMSSISFSLKNELDIRRQARIEAAKKAQEKAEDITKALGVVLEKAVSIEETAPTRVYSQQVSQSVYLNPFNPSTNQMVPAERIPAMDETIGSGLFAQTIFVTSEVRVVFEIKQMQ